MRTHVWKQNTSTQKELKKVDSNMSWKCIHRYLNIRFGAYLGAIHKCQQYQECTNHILSETPSPQKSTHQHFLSAKNPHENNKNQAKKLKVYGKNVDFHRPLLRKCMVCTLVKMLTFMDGPLAVYNSAGLLRWV